MRERIIWQFATVWRLARNLGLHTYRDVLSFARFMGIHKYAECC